MSESPPMLEDLPLYWDNSVWLGHAADLGLLGKEISVHVETETGAKTLPHPLQVALWKRVQVEHARYAALVQEGLFHYYCSIRPQYEGAGPEWVERMPPLNHKEQLSDLLTLNYVRLRWPTDSDYPAIGFSYSCQWDTEHGAGILIKGDTIVDVGGADCVLCS